MSVRVQPGSRPTREFAGRNHGRGHAHVGRGRAVERRPQVVVPPNIRPQPNAHCFRRDPVYHQSSRPEIHYMPQVYPTHETAYLDSVPRHSVTVIHSRSSGKAALVAALIGGIMLAVFGTGLVSVNPIGGLTLLGVGGVMAFFSGAGLKPFR